MESTLVTNSPHKPGQQKGSKVSEDEDRSPTTTVMARNTFRATETPYRVLTHFIQRQKPENM